MTNLNAVNIGHNKYCGPAVLSILTGKSTDECANVISSINGKYTIEGVLLSDLLKAADILGFDSTPVNSAASLFGTLIRLVNDDGLYIVAVAKHFVAIEVKEKKIYFCDNHTKEPMPAASSARLQQPVKAVYKVSKRREPLLLGSKFIASRWNDIDGIDIRINKVITYDIPKYDNTVQVARLKFNNDDDLDEFITSLKEC